MNTTSLYIHILEASTAPAKCLYLTYFEKYWGCYITLSTPSSVASKISVFQPSDFKENLTNMRRLDY